MPSTREVQDLLDQAQDIPQGAAQVEVLERAVALADEVGDRAMQRTARVALANGYYHVPTTPHEIPVYAWLLRSLDDGDVPEEEARQILWVSKWTMGQMLDFPQVPLDTVRATFEEIGTRMRRAGYTDRAYAQHRTRLARDVDDESVVDEWLARWRGAARDGISDCHACENRELAGIMADRGDLTTALELVAPTLAGELRCGDEPAATLGRAAGWSMRNGAVEDAMTQHLQGWRLVADDRRHAADLARHLVFLVRSGNGARAMRLAAPRVGWVEQIESPAERMEYAAALAVVLEAAVAAGLAPDSVGGEATADLARRLRGEADALARKFDERNGTDRVSSRLWAWVTAAPFATPLDLGPLADAEDGPAQPETASGPAETPAPEAPLPATLAQWAQASRDSIDAFDEATTTRLMDAWPEHRDRLTAEADERDLGDAAYLERQVAGRLADSGEHEAAAALLARSAELADRAGHSVQSLRTRAAAAHLAALQGDEEALERGVAMADELEALGALKEAAATLAILGRQGDRQRVAELLRRAADLYDRADQRRWAAVVRQNLAWVLMGTDVDAAEQELDRIEGEVQASGLPGLVVAQHVFRSRLLRVRDDLPGSLEQLRAGVRAAGSDRSGDGAREELCDVLSGTGDWDELLAVATDYVASARKGGDRRSLAAAQRYYGLAATETGRPLEGAEAIEAAIAVFREVDTAALGPANWGLGNALTALGEPGAARAAFLDAAAAFEAQERPNETGHGLFRAAEASWDLQDLGRATELFEQATPYAAQTGDLNLFLSCRRGRGATLALSGELQEGLAILDSAIADTVALQRELEIDATVDEDYLKAMVDRQAASILADRGEWSQAVKRAERSEAALVPLSLEVAAMVRVDRGRYLAGAGRSAEAEAALRDALSDLADSQDVSARVEAASGLAQFLDSSGRGEEAEEVWSRYGPDAGPPAGAADGPATPGS